MLRNVIVHIANEQPFMADLVNDPSPSDVCLICRNMRTMNGKKPVYVDYADSTFVLPIAQIRFIEIPAASFEEAAPDDEGPVAVVGGTRRARRSDPPGVASDVREIRGKRSKTSAPAPRTAQRVSRPTTVPVEPEGPDESPAEAGPDDASDRIVLLGSAYHDAELDADLLRRIREA